MFNEPAALLFHALFQRLLFRDALLRCILPHALGDFHRAEVRAAHGAKVRGLCAFLRERFVVELARGHGSRLRLN